MTALPKNTGVSSPAQEALAVEGVAGAVEQLDLLAQRRALASPSELAHVGLVEVVRPSIGGHAASRASRALEDVDAGRVAAVVDAAERRGPMPIGQFIGAAPMPSTLLDLVEQLERLARPGGPAC